MDNPIDTQKPPNASCGEIALLRDVSVGTGISFAEPHQRLAHANG